MGIKKVVLMVVLPVVLFILFLMLYVFKVKNGFVAFGVSLTVSTLAILIFFKLVEVKGYERLVVSRGGTFIDSKIAKGGRAFLFRGLEKPITIDMRPTTELVTDERCFTEEGVGIDISYFFLWKVKNHMDFLLAPGNIPATMKGMASARLRTEVGKMSLEKVLMRREDISKKLKDNLTNPQKAQDWGAWGVEFITIELGSMKIPADVEEAMNRKMKATKRKEATVIEAQASADALTIMKKVLNLKDDEVASLQMVKMLSEGEATKYILPMELMDLLRRRGAPEGGAEEQERRPEQTVEKKSGGEAKPEQEKGKSEVREKGESDRP